MKNCIKICASAILILLSWHFSSIMISRNMLPAPYPVIKNTVINFSGDLSIHCLYSLKRIFLGITLAASIAWPLGIVLGYFKKLDNLISPIIYILYPVPKIAFLPIFMLLFGLGDVTKIAMIFVIIFFQIIVNTRDAVRIINPSLFFPLKVLGASTPQLFIHVVAPYSLPVLVSSIRIALGTGIAVLFFSETFGSQYGLGYYIMDSMMRIDYIGMFSGILILSILGLILFTLTEYTEKKLTNK